MRRDSLLSAVFMLTLTPALGVSVYAATVWDPAGSGVYLPATGNWPDPGNWTNGLSSVVADGKVQFYLTNVAECVAADTQTCQVLVRGNNGAFHCGGHPTDHLVSGVSYLTIDPTATAEFIGNIINADSGDMPVNDPPEVICTGNLRVY